MHFDNVSQQINYSISGVFQYKFLASFRKKSKAKDIESDDDDFGLRDDDDSFIDEDSDDVVTTVKPPVCLYQYQTKIVYIIIDGISHEF